MLISTLAITAVVFGAVAIVRTLTGDDDAAGGDVPAWSEVVLVDRATGDAVAVDADGLATTLNSSPGRVVDVHVEASTIALVQSAQVSIVSPLAAAPTVIALPTGTTVTRLPIAGRLWLAAGRAAGGNVLLIDALAGTTYDVAALAEQTEPRYYVETIRYDEPGDTFAIADAANFQTIVVRTAEQPAAVQFYPDVPIAVSADRVVTSQVVGQQADLTLHDRDRRPLATVSGSLPIAGWFEGDEAWVMTIDGGIVRFGEGDTSADRAGTVDIPPGAAIRSVSPALGRQRLVVIGDVFEAIVDDRAAPLFTATFTSPIDPPAVERDWACLPAIGTGVTPSLISLETGAVLADLTGLTILAIAEDGCTVLGARDGTTVVVRSDGSTLDLGVTRDAALAPDGTAAVRLHATGSVDLVRFDGDQLDEPLDLTVHAPSNPIVTFRTR